MQIRPSRATRSPRAKPHTCWLPIADHVFWPDHQPFAAATEFTGQRLVGHQQVTDAYLLGLALKQGGVLATLDERIASLTTPKTAERKALEIIA